MTRSGSPASRRGEQLTCDLLVVGGGMAGLSAAAYATGQGLSAVVVDRAPAVGGSAAYAGIVWTAPSYEVFRAEIPDGDPRLAAAITADVDEDTEWLASIGVTCGPAMELMRFGRGRRVDTGQFIQITERRVRDAPGSAVLAGCETTRLLTGDGSVLGAEVRLASGETREIAARHTLLATGGFQGDPDLRARRIHPNARDVPLRANRYSRGDGMRLGIAAGAAFGPEQAGFYGHLIPYGTPLTDPALFVERAMYCSEHTILVNLAGQRFTDESMGDHLNTIAVLEQPGARALMIADQRAHDDWMITPFTPDGSAVDKFEIARRAGARCAVAADVDEFGYLPPEWGYPAAAVRASIERFNDECRRGSEPPRRYDPAPLEKPPFYVMEVGPAITFTYSGLRIDDQARVVNGAGAPIPGLLAAGADAGGVFVRGYAGGLANALVFGLRAARTACGQPASSADR